MLMGVKDVASIATSELYGGKKENEVFIYVTLNEKGKTISTNIHYPVYSNQYAYPKVAPDYNCGKDQMKESIYGFALLR
ncbi:MAG: hypothetical protein ACLURQ_04415 [Bacteroides thetaiotaomicron]